MWEEVGRSKLPPPETLLPRLRGPDEGRKEKSRRRNEEGTVMKKCSRERVKDMDRGKVYMKVGNI